MDLGRLDLNLLLSLEVLLDELSVSRAAERLGVGQPAMSASLSRLRRHFDDQLLERVGNQYRPTPLAVELGPRVQVAVLGLQRVFDPDTAFDPETTDREFTLLTSDYGETVLGGPVGRIMSRESPRATLRFVPNTVVHRDQSDPALLAADLALMPHGFVTDLAFEDLCVDEWVCVVSADNRGVGEVATAVDLQRRPWVVTFHGPTGTIQGVATLRVGGIEPEVRVVTESFHALPGHIVGTDRIGLVQRRLAPLLPRQDEIRIVPCGATTGELVIAMWWHPVHERNPAHRWFRGVMRRVARELD